MKEGVRDREGERDMCTHIQLYTLLSSLINLLIHLHACKHADTHMPRVLFLILNLWCNTMLGLKDNGPSNRPDPRS